MDTLSTLDRGELIRRFAGRELLLRRVVEISSRTFPELMEKIRREVSEEVWASAKRDCHSLKGQLKSFYAIAAFQRLKQLEHTLDVGDREAATELLEFLEEDITRLQRSLEDLT